MLDSRSEPNRRLLALRRTELLRRMLLVRHFTEHDAAVPIAGRELRFRSGEEAVAAGAWAALGPADVMVPAGKAGAAPSLDAGPTAAVVYLLRDEDVRDANAWIDIARRRRLPLLLCREHGSDPTSAPGAVDGRDVEAVWVAIRDGLRARRAAGCFPVLDVHTGSRSGADPIAVLATKMFADHQLDGNALRAIDSGTAIRVETLLALRDPGALPVVSAPG